MKWLHNITTWILLCVLVQVQAQQEGDTRGSKSFDDFAYIKAAEQYEKAVQKGDLSEETLSKLADSYYFMGNMEKASKWYGTLFAQYGNNLDPTHAFRYIQALEGVENYTQAKALMKIYEERFKEQHYAVEQFKDNDALLDELTKKAPEFFLNPVTINTRFSDFSSSFYGNSLVFASSRDSSNVHTRLYNRNNQPYLNLFIADTILQGTDLHHVVSFPKSVNSKYHEGGASFSPDLQTIYFTRNNYIKKAITDAEGVNNLKIYRAQRDSSNFQWDDVEELPFNSDDFSTGHPTVSPDGKKLYFVSDRPGGIGSTDIYRVDILDDGSFSQPVNLGPTINTAGKEMFPFVTAEKLYFSSNGHLGYGGLDVFEAKFSDGLTTVNNLGKPLNSSADDFGYMVKEDTQRGYVSSNRPGGKGDDDIYTFLRQSPCVQTLQGKVVDLETQLPLSEATISFSGSTGEVLATAVSDQNGHFRFPEPLECGTPYTLTASKTKYEDQTLSGNLSENPVTIPLKPFHELIVTDGETLKIDIGILYFDFDKSDITPRGAVELDKVVEVMQQYPGMVIKIESHTDSRGKDDYNLQLSDRRAKATRDYILGHGIQTERIESAIGYGETHLLNRCSNGVNCDEAEHSLNRRSEFIIIKMK